ncbi:MAG TPA: hypothetical protein VHI10_11665, partial [Mycobacterium sp.]|nr:hypothetical protein [Mycobacterium sp.]
MTMPVPDDDAAAEVTPADRSELARTRADELRERTADLLTGVGATAETAEQARVRAEQALDRARNAHHAAAERHVDAGRA